MGCCQTKKVPTHEHQESAFKQYSSKQKEKHHTGDSNFTLSSIGKSSDGSQYVYKSKYDQIKSQQTQSSQDLDPSKHQMMPSSSPSPDPKPNPNPNPNPNKQIINPQPTTNPSPKKQASNPLKYDKVNTNDITNNSNNNLQPTRINVPQNRDREPSVSKSRSRQFRTRNEPNSPSKPSDHDHKAIHNNIVNANNDGVQRDKLPNFEDDAASSESSEMVIPGLVFSDDDDDDDDDSDDNYLIKMHLIVQNENERLLKEINHMKTLVDQEEIKRLEKECLKEIELEEKERLLKQQQQQQQQTGTTDDDADDNNRVIDVNISKFEQEKQKKFQERFFKKQKQREKEKAIKKEQRRIKKEEKKKKQKANLLKQKMIKRQKERIKKRNEARAKRKKEIEQYALPEQKPSRKQIINMFDKFFFKPFDANKVVKHKKDYDTDDSDMSSDEDSDDDDDLDEFDINLDGFKAGLGALEIDKIITSKQIGIVWNHMTDSVSGVGINAYDFSSFLKQKTITLKPKLAIIQTKILKRLIKQQDMDDNLSKTASKMTIQISDFDPQNGDNDDNDKDDKVIDNIPVNKVDIAVIDNDVDMNDNPPDIDHDDDVDDVHNDDNTSADIILPHDDINDINPTAGLQRGDTVKSGISTVSDRRDSISLSASISMTYENSILSQTTQKRISAIPRASFRNVKYQMDDVMSTKAFNKYKKLRQRFGSRYHHQKKKTMDEQLMNGHEIIFKQNTLNNDDKKVDTVKDADDDKKQDDMKITDTDKDKDGIQAQAQMPPITQTVLTMGTQLSGIDENKDKKYDVDDNKNNDNDKAIAKDKDKPLKPGVSIAKSRKTIAGYQGNDDLMQLRKLYKKQHKMKKKLEHLRKRSLLSLPAPPKPSNISDYIDNNTKYITKELKLCICKNTRYTGLANFGRNGELGIEIEFTSNVDNDGNITGNRVVSFKNNKLTSGKGRLWQDLVWNGHKYLPACKFEWIDTANDITTKFEFNSVSDEIDVDHSFFSGKCCRYPSNLNPNQRNTQLIMHQGFFDFVCVSARRRTIRKNSMLQYHTLDINDLDENELKKVPKYVRRMSAYTEKIDKLYNQNTNQTKDALFGDALKMASTIQDNTNSKNINDNTNSLVNK